MFQIRQTFCLCVSNFLNVLNRFSPSKIGSLLKGKKSLTGSLSARTKQMGEAFPSLHCHLFSSLVVLYFDRHFNKPERGFPFGTHPEVKHLDDATHLEL